MIFLHEKMEMLDSYLMEATPHLHIPHVLWASSGDVQLPNVPLSGLNENNGIAETL
jgi:hypothetical protein